MRICIAQINFRPENPEEHLANLREIIVQRAASDLIVFPELILHGHPSEERPEGFLYRKMKARHRDLSEELYRFVQSSGARVIIGESKRRSDYFYNVATYIDGDRVESYTKTHVHWTEHFKPGSELKVFDSPWGKIGITICFDSAFSEVWRVLALRGAWLAVNVSAVPRDFPPAFMRRRLAGAAVFNQMYVVYANRPGPHFSGHSAVFDPQGRIVAELDDQDGLLEVDVDFEAVRRWREMEKLFAFRQPMLYRDLIRRPGPQTKRVSPLPVTVSPGFGESLLSPGEKQKKAAPS